MANANGRDAQRPAGRNRFVCLANSSPKRRSHALTASLCLVRPSARTHACCPRLAGLAVRAALSSFLQGFKVCCWQIKTQISHRITAGGKRRVASVQKRKKEFGEPNPRGGMWEKERKKTDKPNEGWGRRTDRVPTCTSRILEDDQGDRWALLLLTRDTKGAQRGARWNPNSTGGLISEGGKRKKETKQTTQGRDRRTARRHHTGILRRGVWCRRDGSAPIRR